MFRGRWCLASSYAVAGVAPSTSAGTLGVRVPTPKLALGLQRVPDGSPVASGDRRPDRMRGVDLDTFRWLLTDDGQALLVRATQLYVDHAGDPVRTATALRATTPAPSTSPRR